MTVRNEDGSTGWHPEIIKAELHKRGHTLRSLSLANGYKRDSLKSVLRTPCLAYEKIVADALGVPPETIWPIRYEARKTSYIRKAA
ncbi:helix-turn-helix domain-containing protein [Aeromonas enteropelogenes]|uniref:helix-turn-helix domain-containing protein n=1 Tax=Aeromonas enteropelogenes TaxID=29489 RepID=UPI003BA34E3C